MRTAFRYGLSLIAAALVLALAFARADELPSLDGPWETSLDFDRDGKADRAIVTYNSDDDRMDLRIYLAAGEGKFDPTRKPSFVKAGIAEGGITDLESKSHALVIKSGYNLYGSEWDAAITIAYRQGDFWVTYISSSWEWNIRKSDIEVEVRMGACDIDLLAGSGMASDSLDDMKPLNERFSPVRLAEWSKQTRPQKCDF
jgi:hypothetical protein